MSTILYAPQLGGTGIVSALNLVNAGDSTATVTLTANAGSAPITIQVKLAPRQLYSKAISNIFSFDASTVGSLKVSSDTGNVFGDVFVSDSSFTPAFAYSVPLTSQTSPSFFDRLPVQLVKQLAAQGTNLQVSLDGDLLTFTQGATTSTAVSIPATGGSNNGATGIAFGSADNRGLAGGQRASNFVLSSYRPRRRNYMGTHRSVLIEINYQD